MAKKGLHPTWYKAKIMCDDSLIFEVGATKKKLVVDIWAGNHPFYTGSKKLLDREGHIDKFMHKYNFERK